MKYSELIEQVKMLGIENQEVICWLSPLYRPHKAASIQLADNMNKALKEGTPMLVVDLHIVGEINDGHK